MKTRMTVFLAGALLVALSGSASANGRINFGISIGVPGYAYMAPPPAYYYSPPPVYYAPAPVYYAPPRAYYAPAPWAVGSYRGWDRHPRHWNGRHW
jgi:hypothetical protein